MNQPVVHPERERKMRNFVLLCVGLTILFVVFAPAFVPLMI